MWNTDIFEVDDPKDTAADLLGGGYKQLDTRRCIYDELIPSVAADFRRTQIHTKSTQVHKAGEDYDPGVHAIDYVATIELGEAASNI